jgi:hypothetical protein
MLFISSLMSLTPPRAFLSFSHLTMASSYVFCLPVTLLHHSPLDGFSFNQNLLQNSFCGNKLGGKFFVRG